MGEPQSRCVEEEAIEAGKGPASVVRVSEHRGADGREVGADLMEHPGVDPDLEQRRIPRAGHDAEVGQGLAASPGHCRLDMVTAVTEREIDLALIRDRAGRG